MRRTRYGKLTTAYRSPIAGGIYIAENPNTGNRKPSNPPRYRLTEDGAPQVLRTFVRSI